MTFFICLLLFVLLSAYIYVAKFVLIHCAQAVAVKQLDRNGVQGNREFLVEVLMPVSFIMIILLTLLDIVLMVIKDF